MIILLSQVQEYLLEIELLIYGRQSRVKSLFDEYRIKRKGANISRDGNAIVIGTLCNEITSSVF